MKKCIKAVLVMGVLVLLVYAFHTPVLNFVGKALVRSDEIRPVDGIVVLMGDGTGERMSEAINLLKKGYGSVLGRANILEDKLFGASSQTNAC